MQANETQAAIAALPLLLGGEALAGVDWQHGDDLCDHVIQRIGEWRNPYSGHTHRVRLCCFEAKLVELLPELGAFVQDIPAYFDENRAAFVEGVVSWDAPDADMPRALWYRQLAHFTDKTLAEVREQYADQEPPRRLVPEAVWNTLQAARADMRDSTEDDNARSY